MIEVHSLTKGWITRLNRMRTAHDSSFALVAPVETFPQHRKCRQRQRTTALLLIDKHIVASDMKIVTVVLIVDGILHHLDVVSRILVQSYGLVSAFSVSGLLTERML